MTHQLILNIQMKPKASVSRRQEPETEDSDREGHEGKKTCDFCSRVFSKPANLQKHLETNKKCSPHYYDKIESERKRQKSQYDQSLTRWRRDDVMATYITELMSCDFIK